MKTNNIAELREKSGLSRAELSRRSGVPLRTLEDWDSGRNIPRDVYQLYKVAKVLNCRIEDLIIEDINLKK
jgi:DNA-binding transcriptional regulator YiaG